MTMQEDKKRNISLIIGLSIPVAMMLFIAIAINGPRWFNTVDPAQYDFLYTTGQNNPYATYSVVNGRLSLHEQTMPEGTTPVTQYMTRFFVHDVANNTSKEIQEEDAMALALDGSIRSPDGFTVEAGRRGGWFIFGYHGNSGSRYLVKEGLSQKLKLESDSGSRTYYWNFQLLGWVVNDG